MLLTTNSALEVVRHQRFHGDGFGGLGLIQACVRCNHTHKDSLNFKVTANQRIEIKMNENMCPDLCASTGTCKFKSINQIANLFI